MWETFILTLGKEGGKNTIYCCSCSLPPSHTYTSFSNIGEAVLAIWGVVSRFSLTVQEETLPCKSEKKEKSIQEYLKFRDTMRRRSNHRFPFLHFSHYKRNFIHELFTVQVLQIQYMPKCFLGSINYLKICLLNNILEPYFPQFPSRYKKFNFQHFLFLEAFNVEEGSMKRKSYQAVYLELQIPSLNVPFLPFLTF